MVPLYERMEPQVPLYERMTLAISLPQVPLYARFSLRERSPCINNQAKEKPSAAN
jgi:hypothetical protein